MDVGEACWLPVRRELSCSVKPITVSRSWGSASAQRHLCAGLAVAPRGGVGGLLKITGEASVPESLTEAGGGLGVILFQSLLENSYGESSPLSFEIWEEWVEGGGGEDDVEDVEGSADEVPSRRGLCP